MTAARSHCRNCGKRYPSDADWDAPDGPHDAEICWDDDEDDCSEMDGWDRVEELRLEVARLNRSLDAVTAALNGTGKALADALAERDALVKFVGDRIDWADAGAVRPDARKGGVPADPPSRVSTTMAELIEDHRRATGEAKEGDPR